jgi:hypothetical protein
MNEIKLRPGEEFVYNGIRFTQQELSTTSL